MTEEQTPLRAATPRETSSQFESAMNAGDLEALMTLYEEGATSASSATESIHGLDAIRQSLGSMAAMKPRMRLTPTSVLENQGLAMVVGDWTMEATAPDGQAISTTGRYCDVVRRQDDGRWLFCIDNPWVG